jgi:hypothetical protein
MLDALAHQPDRLRGVAVADADVSQTIRRGSLGVRGLRFNHFSATGNCTIAAGCRCSGGQKFAPVMAGLDGIFNSGSTSRTARDHTDTEINGLAGGDRSWAAPMPAGKRPRVSKLIARRRRG